jgi:predicted SAM-dependent methyltransferase
MPETAHISQNIENLEVPSFLLNNKNAKILHLGAGNVKSNDPRVISTDILANNNVDIVCEGEKLPFLDETFDYITSGAVLEHVSNPIAVSKEMRREF